MRTESNNQFVLRMNLFFRLSAYKTSMANSSCTWGSLNFWAKINEYFSRQVFFVYTCALWLLNQSICIIVTRYTLYVELSHIIYKPSEWNISSIYVKLFNSQIIFLENFLYALSTNLKSIRMVSILKRTRSNPWVPARLTVFPFHWSFFKFVTPFYGSKIYVRVAYYYGCSLLDISRI